MFSGDWVVLVDYKITYLTTTIMWGNDELRNSWQVCKFELAWNIQYPEDISEQQYGGGRKWEKAHFIWNHLEWHISFEIFLSQLFWIIDWIRTKVWRHRFNRKPSKIVYYLVTCKNMSTISLVWIKLLKIIGQMM